MNPTKTKSPETLTTEEASELMNVLLHYDGSNKQLERGVRNFTMACCMLDAGLRVGEVTKLRVFDLYFNKDPVTSIVIRAEISKSKRERTIPTTQRLRSSLAMLNREILVPNCYVQDAYAFGFLRGCAPITSRQIQRIICAAAQKAFGRDCHPHVLRHTFASKLMRTTNIRIVQELLGHKQLSSTQIYTHPNGDDLRKAIDNLE